MNKNINNLKFADDIDLLEEDRDELQAGLRASGRFRAAMQEAFFRVVT